MAMTNPFKPGNGVEPAYLAGRREQIQEFTKSLKAFEEGLPRNAVLYGLRGTGKTVLLRHYKILAETSGWLFIEREFNERYCSENEFADIFGKDLAAAASEASIRKRILETGKKLFSAVKPEELGAYGITYKPFYQDRREVLEDYIGKILEANWPIFEKAGKKGVVFLYDEFHLVRDRKDERQYVLSSLLTAIAKVQREGLRYYLCLSGLPLLKTNLKAAKTYAERMFIFQEIENLEPKEAEKALTEPLKKEGYEFTEGLTRKIIEETAGYPYFLQFYGYFLIEHARTNRVTGKDFETQRPELLKALDKSFFDDRYRLASEAEKTILQAMAESGKKEAPASQLAKKTRMNDQMLQQYLARLTDKGLVFRPQRGHYAFSIPLFKEYLLRRK